MARGRRVLSLTSWGLTVLSGRLNRRERGGPFYVALGSAALFAAAGGAALLAGPWTAGMNPTSHVYPAIVWLLVVWTWIHVTVGLMMQLYCMARRAAGRMTPRYDNDIRIIVLYWHFAALTAAVTIAVIAGFPQVA